jgi:hypothetical protein
MCRTSEHEAHTQNLFYDNRHSVGALAFDCQVDGDFSASLQRLGDWQVDLIETGE